MDAPANSAFSGPITSIFNSMHFDGDPFTCQCEKEDKKAYGFQILHCHGSFSSDTMAVKGLMYTCMYIPGDSQSVQLWNATTAANERGRSAGCPSGWATKTVSMVTHTQSSHPMKYICE